MKIYFRDLTQEAQACALEEAGVSDPREMNWDMFPVGEISVGGSDNAGGDAGIMKTISPRDITGVTLLSTEEYMEAKAIVPKLNEWWWLRSPGSDNISAAVVNCDGILYDHGNFVNVTGGSVRPALRLNPESGNFRIGEKVRAAGLTWTVIPGGLALCDEFIGKHCFRKDREAPDANDYEASDIKRYIEGWAREHGLLPQEITPSDVADITLLSAEEYLEALEAKDIVSRLDGLWWLRSPGSSSYSAADVDDDGGVIVDGDFVDDSGVSVRPALRLNPESDNPQIGDRVLAAGHTWTVIPGNLALCDEFIGKHCFRKDWDAPDANDYEASDVRKFLKGWARERGLMPACDAPAATVAGACADAPRSDP